MCCGLVAARHPSNGDKSSTPGGQKAETRQIIWRTTSWSSPKGPDVVSTVLSPGTRVKPLSDMDVNYMGGWAGGGVGSFHRRSRIGRGDDGMWLVSHAITDGDGAGWTFTVASASPGPATELSSMISIAHFWNFLHHNRGVGGQVARMRCSGIDRDPARYLGRKTNIRFMLGFFPFRGCLFSRRCWRRPGDHCAVARTGILGPVVLLGALSQILGNRLCCCLHETPVRSWGWTKALC